MKYKIEDCFLEIRNGANIKQGTIDGGIPITRIETLADDKFNRDRMGYAGITEVDKYYEYVLQDGDLLMSHINSPKYLGRTVVYHKQEDETIIHGMNLLKLRVKKNILIPDFAELLFVSFTFRSQVAKIMKKSVNQASFSVSDLKKIVIDIPSIDVQIDIVNKFYTIREILNGRDKQLKMLDELIKSKFVYMFGDPVRNDKNWERLDCKKLTTKIGSGATPKGGNSSYKEKGISLIRSMNVYNNMFQTKDLAFIDDEQAKKLDNVTVEKDDVLLNITGASVARCCIVPEDLLPARVNQHVSIIRCKQNEVNPIFLSNMLTNDSYQKLLWSIATSGGATREALTKQQVEALLVIIPPIELQQQFTAFVKQVDKLKVELQKSLAEVQLLFDSLMNKYFN